MRSIRVFQANVARKFEGIENEADPHPRNRFGFIQDRFRYEWAY
jgi:hypothetical protein